MPPFDPGLQQLSDLDRDSPQFHVGLSNFFGGNVYQNLLSRLNSEDLAWLVEYLGNVSLRTVLCASPNTFVGPRGHSKPRERPISGIIT